jgi:hypothetical protein
MKYPFVV